MTYSPALAVASGFLEFAAAAWVFLGPRGGRRRVLHPIGIIFLLLAAYQFAEVAVCSRPDVGLYTRLAFFDITWLPPMALWLSAQLGGRRMRWLRTAAVVDLALALGLSVWIFADPGSVTGSVCGTVIARYAQAPVFNRIYGAFYQLSLGVVVFGAAAGMALTDDHVLRKHWANLQAGILGFLLPALAYRVLVDESRGNLPSVMCHFALALAVSLVFAVVRERRSGTA